MFRVLVVLFLIFIGCEDSQKDYCLGIEPQYSMKELYVDSECNDISRNGILDAVDDFNILAENNICQPLVEVIGEITVSHEKNPQIDVDTILCYNEEPDWYEDSRAGENDNIGRTFSIRTCDTEYCYIDRYMQLFLFRRSPATYTDVLKITKHELFHYVDIHGHISGPAIMTPTINGSKYYSDNDIDFFCEKFDCVH